MVQALQAVSQSVLVLLSSVLPPPLHLNQATYNFSLLIVFLINQILLKSLSAIITIE